MLANTKQEPGGVTKFRLRRRFIVDPKLQFRLVKDQLGVFGFALLALAAGMFYPLLRELSQEIPDELQAQSAAEAMLYMHDWLWPVLACVAVFVVLALTRISHQIAGPMVRVRRMIVALSEGQSAKSLRLRKNDYFKPEAELLNRLQDSLAQRDQEREELIHRMEQLEQRLLDVPGLIQEDRSSLCGVASEIREVAENHERFLVGSS